ncbi:MAG: hypothetical protein HC908_03990 [Calothrix sp. SM1_7_51]|nr:hypothetical protein [Calothrix sp. SM1_7_51]
MQKFLLTTANSPEQLEFAPEFTSVINEQADELNLVQPSTQAEIDFFATLLEEGESEILENAGNETHELFLANSQENILDIDLIETESTFIESFDFDDFETEEQFDTFEQSSLEIESNQELELTFDSDLSLTEPTQNLDVEDNNQVNKDDFSIFEELLDSNTTEQPETEESLVPISPKQDLEFAQLEALLDDTQNFNDAPAYKDEFAQLDALLDITTQNSISSNDEFAQLEALLDISTPEPTTPVSNVNKNLDPNPAYYDSEFSDLENC